VQGDDLRDVAWKASARHRKLITKEYRLDRSQDVVVCLDRGHRMAARVAHVTRLDHAVNRDHRRLGDILADTLVVQERTPLTPQGDLRLDRRFNALATPALRRRIRQRVSLEEREFLLTLCLRADRLTESARYDLMDKVGTHYRERLDITDPHLSNENLVRDLTAVLYGQE